MQCSITIPNGTLSTVTFEHQQKEPHRIPLNDRTRQLMLRKLDRADAPKLPVDHEIDPEPEEGMPLPGASGRHVEVDAETGQQTIRRSGNPLSRSLRQRLREKTEEMAAREAEEKFETEVAKKDSEEEKPSRRVIEAGGSLSRRLRDLKKKRR